MLNLNFNSTKREFENLDDHRDLSYRMALYNEVFQILKSILRKNLMCSGNSWFVTRNNFASTCYILSYFIFGIDPRKLLSTKLMFFLSLFSFSLFVNEIVASPSLFLSLWLSTHSQTPTHCLFPSFPFHFIWCPMKVCLEPNKTAFLQNLTSFLN